MDSELTISSLLDFDSEYQASDDAQDIDILPESDEDTGIISFPRLAMVGNTMQIVDDYIFSVDRKDQLHKEMSSPKSNDAKSPTKLVLVKGCGGRNKESTGDFFTMPLLRLGATEKEYSEPVRDRDKNWALDSQREVLNRTPRSMQNHELVLFNTLFTLRSAFYLIIYSIRTWANIINYPRNLLQPCGLLRCKHSCAVNCCTARRGLSVIRPVLWTYMAWVYPAVLSPRVQRNAF